MGFNIENLIVDRPLRATLFDKTTSEVIFTIDQITDPSLECTTESAEVRDAIGSKIAEFDRSKDASFSGSNAIISLGLMAAQFGSNKEVASTTNKIVVPKFEIIELGETGGVVNGNITLAETPKTALKYIYRLASDKSISEKIEAGATATTEFTISGKEITLPTTPAVAYVATDRFAVWYDFECDGSSEGLGAVRVSNMAEAFARGGKIDIEVLFADICNPNVKYYGHIVSNNAKMDGNVSLTFNNETTHGFSIKIMQDYCSTNKKLFDIIIPE